MESRFLITLLMILGMNPRRLLWTAGCLVLAGSGGCTPSVGLNQNQNPDWPYARVLGHTSLPFELNTGFAFGGRWIAGNPDNDLVLTETADPRFVALISSAAFPTTYLDFGMGSKVENLVFLDQGRSALFVAAVNSPHHGQAVVSRAILRVDLEQRLLVDAIPLPRDSYARGMAVNLRESRVFLLHDDGLGNGYVLKVDLYDASLVRSPVIGAIPGEVARRGLAVDRSGQSVFCVTGGSSSRSDFDPVDSGERRPELLVLEGDSLFVAARVPLDPRMEPRAVAYDEDLDRVYVLEANRVRSRLVIIDAAYLEIRAAVELPEPARDLVLARGYAFLSGGNGIYIVDLDLETWVSHPRISFDLSGEIAVSPDLTTALALYDTSHLGGPGVARIALNSGSVLEVFR